MGEKQYTKATSYVEYFISRGIDCLKPNGFLCYVIGTPVGMGGVPFLDKIVDNPTDTMRKIMDKANLVDAYRLGSGVFTHTDIDSDIILLQKKSN